MSREGGKDLPEDGVNNEHAASTTTNVLPLSIATRNRDKFEIYCGQCFQKPPTQPLRCSRCKVVSYCSQDCQRKHYKRLHKTACIAVDEYQKLLQETRQEHPRPQEEVNQKFGMKIYDVEIEMADCIFQMAYRSSDTLEHGAYLYDKVLDSYIQAFETLVVANLETASHDTIIYQELQKRLDQIRLMLVTLNYHACFLETLEDSLYNRMPLHQSSVSFRVDSNACQLALLLLKLRSHVVASDLTDQQDRKAGMEQSAQKVRAQLTADPGQKEVWAAFFHRGNNQRYNDEGKALPMWGPEVLGWSETSVADQAGSNNGSGPLSLPIDFYLWLQDSCFLNPFGGRHVPSAVHPQLVLPDITKEVEELVEPILGLDDD